VQRVSPLIRSNFASVNASVSNNDTTMLVLMRTYRDITLADGQYFLEELENCTYSVISTYYSIIFIFIFCTYSATFYQHM
jgi:hypothetical protein